MNVTPCQLSDLTISDTESEFVINLFFFFFFLQLELNVKLVEMKATIHQLHEQTEKCSFESMPDGEFYQDIEWLMDLSRKDKNDQLSEIEKINNDYSNRVLNLRPAFF